MNIKPSETYLMFQRIITFLDEWLFYLLLLYLFENNYIVAFTVTAIIGSFMMAISYLKQWHIESQRFFDLK